MFICASSCVLFHVSNQREQRHTSRPDFEHTCDRNHRVLFAIGGVGQASPDILFREEGELFVFITEIGLQVIGINIVIVTGERHDAGILTL